MATMPPQKPGESRLVRYRNDGGQLVELDLDAPPVLTERQLEYRRQEQEKWARVYQKKLLDEEREKLARREEKIETLAEAYRRAGVFGGARAGKTRTVEPTPSKLLSLDELEQENGEATPELIAGLIHTQTVNIMVGESAIGKSPLLVQMAICVAAGIPFLGMPTQQSRVLIVDYENSSQLLSEFLRTIAGFLKVDSSYRKWIKIVQNPSGVDEVAGHVKTWGAEFVTIDALRGLSPLAEVKSDEAAGLIASLQRIPATFLLLHHPRKTDRKAPPPDLEDPDTQVMTWLQEAAGARALINQTFTRIAIKTSDKADLLMRPVVKGRDELGRIYVERVREDGEAQGYVKATGRAMLSLNDKNWFQRLAGQTLKYSELPAILDDRPSKVAAFVRECEAAGVATVSGKAKSKKEPRMVTFVTYEEAGGGGGEDGRHPEIGEPRKT